MTWTSPDGAIATYEDEPPLEDFGIVLVRRGGYAVGRVEDGRLVAHKTGTRYVQGRTKAGGWSQQRYARRRANQADALAGSAADHVVRLVPGDLRIAGGGDRALVAQVLTAADRTLDPGLRWLEVKEPRLASLERAVRDVRSYAVVLNEAARAR
ncbi:acVLRF1 family peptidyl-tRNA hydrolase [Mumia flava]|uniref:acVLRF1 family peptidyl-tRNA hydrolase n=1 Tax=Mumia flava TaxID=1348852 RepID=UPI001B807E61|nr:acVLRF1 family peptidyl-tRNA hydrolase [Mumia flava]